MDKGSLIRLAIAIALGFSIGWFLVSS